MLLSHRQTDSDNRDSGAHPDDNRKPYFHAIHVNQTP
jgi:hypothetical protein